MASCTPVTATAYHSPAGVKSEKTKRNVIPSSNPSVGTAQLKRSFSGTPIHSDGVGAVGTLAQTISSARAATASTPIAP